MPLQPPNQGTEVSPASSSDQGIPVTFWGDTLLIETFGPSGCLVALRLDQGERVIGVWEMEEIPADSGRYVAEIPPLVPEHGLVEVNILFLLGEPGC